jgi:HEAT repeat protein
MFFFTPNIRKLTKKNNIPELLKCLEHRRAEVRYSAFVALAARVKDPDPQIIMKLRTMVDDPDPWVKSIAILKFAELGDASISDNLMEIIVKGSRSARIELLKIIADRGPTDDQAVLMVIMNALADKQNIVRRNAIVAAGATGNRRLVPYLADGLHEKQFALRMRTADALCALGGEESIDCLIALLADKHALVRARAQDCLAESKLEYVQKAMHDAAFVNLVAGMNGKEPVRRITARRIGDGAIREGLPLLHRACRDKYKGVRIEALKAIAVFKNPSSIEFIAKCLYDKYYDVRLEAVNALEQIKDGRSLKALEGACNDRKKHVREAAQRARHRMQQSLH